MHTVDQGRCDAGLVRCVYKNAICSGTQRPCRYGPVNVVDALAVSSDSFFYRIGEDIMAATTSGRCCRTRCELFGFGSDTGIDLPFEFDGTVPDKELKKRYAELGVISEDEGRGYFAGDNVQLAIGQGLLSATPLQLAIGYATIANQGFVLQPQIVKAIWNPGVPDGEPGYVDFSPGTIHEDRSTTPELIRQIPMPDEVRLPDRRRACGACRHAGRGRRVGLLPLDDRREPVLRLPGRGDPDRRQDRHRPGRQQLSRGTTRRCSPAFSIDDDAARTS